MALAIAFPSSGDGLYGANPALPAVTAVKVDGASYGAAADERGPIGGGAGYLTGVRGGDHVVRDLDTLLTALATAQSGEVVFLPGDTVIDLTGMVVVESLVLELPAGVTLASDRGIGDSPGALLFSDALLTRPLIRVTGENARISGLRLQGPDAERRLDHHRRAYQGTRRRDPDYYYGLPTSDGIETHASNLEVDGCELAGWSHAAVFLRGGTGHRVHHNFIHHCQRQGLGYGRLSRRRRGRDHSQSLRLEPPLDCRHGSTEQRLPGRAQRRTRHQSLPPLRHARWPRPQGRHQHRRHLDPRRAEHLPVPAHCLRRPR